MHAKTLRFIQQARQALPYLWGFGAAAALDHVLDVQSLFLPVIAGIVVLSATSLLLRRPER